MSRRLIPIMILLLLLSGCAGIGKKEPGPQEIVQSSAERMKSLKGFHFSIDRSGAPAYLDSGGTLSLSLMDGNFVAPDKVQADVRVIAPGFVVQVSVISIGTTQWQTNVITRAWEQLPENWGFNPSTLLDPQIGLPSILVSDLSNLVTSGKEEIEEMPGKPLYLLTGTLDGENLFRLSNGLIGPQPLDAKIWVDPQTYDLQRALLTEFAGDAQKERTWQIDFWDFDLVIDIVAPLTS